MFPRDRVIGSLAKYNIPYTEKEETESLVAKLAQFYADRTLTKSPITPADQAEAYFLLVSQRLSKTTAKSSPSTAVCTRRFCAEPRRRSRNDRKKAPARAGAFFVAGTDRSVATGPRHRHSGF